MGLYRKILTQHFETLKDEVGPKAALLVLSDMTIKEFKETGKVKGCLLINSGKECYNRYTDLSHQIRIEFNFMFESFERFVKEAQERGEISNQTEAKVIAGRYMNTFNGLIVTIQAGASGELIDDLIQSLRELLE